MSLDLEIGNVPAEPAALSPGRLETISPLTRERISVGPPPAWVVHEEIDTAPEANSKGRCDVLLSDTQVHAEKHERYDRSAQRLETMQAIQHAGQWRVQIDPATQWLTIHSVRLRRGEETIEQANLAKLRVLQREDRLEDQVVSGTVTVVLVLEDVRLGDVLDASFTITTQTRLLPDRFHFFASAARTVPLRRFQFRVLFPAGDSMQWKTPRASMVPAVRELEGLTEWRWELRDLEPPANETRIPSSVVTAPWMQVSNLASWSELAEAVRLAWREGFAGEELRRQVEAIAAAEPTLAGRVNRAVTCVQDEIRYLSDNLELGGHIPSDPDVVLRRRFGDCKDKSFLLVHLLRCLGVPARAWLVNTRLDERLRGLLPANVFDHVVVEFELEGARRWVDATVHMQGGGALERGTPWLRIGLPIAPEVAGLEILPPSVPAGTFVLTERFRLDTTGRAVCLQVTRRATGSEADRWRATKANLGAHGLAEDSARNYGAVFRDARRLGEFEWRDDREKNVVETGEAYELPHALTKQSQGYFFGHRAYLMQTVLGLPSNSETRKFSLALRYPCQWEHHVIVESPKFLAKPDTKVREQNAHFAFSLERKRAFSRWSEHFKVETFAPLVSPKDYPAFRERVLAVWPRTEFGYTLPAGGKLGPFNESSLLPAGPASSGGMVGAAASPAPLPLEPMPALGLGRGVPDSPETPLAPPAAPREEIKLTRSAAEAFAEATSPARGSRRRRKSPDSVDARLIWYLIILPLYLIFRAIVTGMAHSH